MKAIVPNVKVWDIYSIIEVGIPNERAERFKTERGLIEHIEHIVSVFSDKVASFGDHIVANRGKLGDNMTCEIKNFGYSYSKKRHQNKAHRVFRLFGHDYYIFVPLNGAETNAVFGVYKYDMKIKSTIYPIEVTISGVGGNRGSFSVKTDIEYKGRTNIS